MKTLFTPLRAMLSHCLFLLVLLGWNAPTASACIDPDTIPSVTVNYSADFTDIEIRLGNLRLHTATPTVFCSCALSSYSAIFTNVKYIAFVKAQDSTDIEPYGNFAEWTPEVVASIAWNNELSNYPDWSGYIAQVINQGLNTGDNVEMVIRASMPPGAIAHVDFLDSMIAVSWLGTDMWLPDQQTMAFAHTGLRNLRSDNSSFVLQEMPDEYFQYLDGLLSGEETLHGIDFDLRLSPNPAAEFITAKYSLPRFSQVKLSVFDVSGRAAWKVWEGEQPEGEQEITLDLTAILPRQGLFLLQMEVDGKLFVRKFVR